MKMNCRIFLRELRASSKKSEICLLFMAGRFFTRLRYADSNENLFYERNLIMNRSSLPISVNTMKKWYETEDKVLQCTLPFQRHSGMWSAIIKSNLIWSILSDSYIPPIVLLKDKRGVDAKGKDIFGYQVLEGQPRLITTLFPFLNDAWELQSAV